MTTHIRTLWLGAIGILLLSVSGGWTQQPPPPPPAVPAPLDPAPQEGVDVMTRGPVHEAFAEPVIRGPQPSPVVPKQPPDPIPELPPEQKPEGDNVRWLPGYWAWDADQQNFVWVSGVWRNLPPGRDWIPGHWTAAGNGWQWTAGYWHDRAQPQVALLPPPPAPVAEAVTPAPNPTAIFAPGCWVYAQDRYLWRPGYWMAYQPGWVWVPAHYVWTPGGFVFVDGYWDFPLQTRGLLFAPVVLDRRVIVRPGWVYRPRYVVSDTFLMGAMFVRLDNVHYYFGDYFEPRYRQLGYQPWVEFRVSRVYPDPLFAYYRVANRQNPAWERDLRQLYVTRRDNPAARPPRTLVQQTQVIRTIRQTTGTNATRVSTAVQRATAVTSLSQVNRSVVKLQPVTAAHLQEVRQTVQRYHALSQERSRMEVQVAGHRSASGLPPERTAPVRVELSRVTTTRSVSGAVRTPPPPGPPHPGMRLPARTETFRPEGRPGERRPNEERRPGGNSESRLAPERRDFRSASTDSRRTVEERRVSTSFKLTEGPARSENARRPPRSESRPSPNRESEKSGKRPDR